MTVVASGQNVKTYPTTQCKLLLILKMGVPVLIDALWMQFIELNWTLYWFGLLTYSPIFGMQTEL